MSKSDPFVEYILTRILSGEYPLGARLPSLRRLAPKFNLTYGAAHRRAEALVRSGILRSRHGRGLFVNRTEITDGPLRGKPLLALVQHGEHAGMSYTALLGFQNRAAQAGFRVELHKVQVHELNADHLAELLAGCAGAAFFKEYDAALDRLPDRLPLVGTLMNRTYGGRLSLVNLDPVATAEQATDYFRRHGVERVVVCSNPRPVYRERAEKFSDCWRLQGGHCQLEYRYWPALRFTSGQGYFFSSDERYYNQDQEYFRHTGRHLADDCVVLSADGKQRTEPDWPVFPSVTVDWREIGGVMFEELFRRLNDPAAPGRVQLLAGALEPGPETPATGRSRLQFHHATTGNQEPS